MDIQESLYKLLSERGLQSSQSKVREEGKTVPKRGSYLHGGVEARNKDSFDCGIQQRGKA